MRLFLFLFFILLSSHIVSAYDCTLLGNNPDCLALNQIDENLISGLIYTNTSYADHQFISDYNSKIKVVNPPENTSIFDKGVIRNAWLSILTISPSVKWNSNLYVPKTIEVRSEYNYSIVLPSDYHSSSPSNGGACQILYDLSSKSESLIFENNGSIIGNGRKFTCDIESDSNITGTLNLKTITKVDEYRWKSYCCGSGCSATCYSCDYSSTNYVDDELSITDSIALRVYQHIPSAEYNFISEYHNTTKGVLNSDNQTNIHLSFINSTFTEQQFEYTAEFSKRPYYFLTLVANEQKIVNPRNLFVDNQTIFVSDPTGCTIEGSDFFQTKTTPCNTSFSGEIISKISKKDFSESWGLLLKLAIFFVILFLIYRVISNYWRRILTPLAVLLLITIPSVHAADCGLTNLASCLPEKFFDFVIQILNAPIQPLLAFMRTLLETAPAIDLFQGAWAIVVYTISMFYGLLFIYSGFQFLLAGHDVIRREMAKEWLKNTVIMIVLVQGSFYIYGLIVDLGAVMASSVLSLVDAHFFLLTADNVVNVGLEFLLVLVYAVILLITILFLVIRYLVVCMGVLLAPIGIFCYFIPPLKSYGKLINGLLGICIFVVFLDAIIILACSMLIDVPLFQNFKIVVMISCFAIINILFLILIKHIIAKSALGDSGEKVAQAVKYIAAFA